MYTPKTVFQDLIAAREEYILSNYRVHKEQNKIMLPNLVDNYVKDAALHPAYFMGIIELILPTDNQRIGTCRYRQKRKDLKDVGWIPHNFSFRYQFPKDMFQWSIFELTIASMWVYRYATKERYWSNRLKLHIQMTKVDDHSLFYWNWACLINMSLIGVHSFMRV